MRTLTGAISISILSWLGEAAMMRRMREHRSSKTGLFTQHVVKILGIGASEDRSMVGYYIVVMEKLEDSLRNILDGYLAQGRQPQLQQALRWLLETAQGVAECHEADVVHSSIKAANALVDKVLSVKISDLGAGRLARTMSASHSGTSNTDAAHNNMLWLASELLDDDSSMPTKASDVYAWAMTAWEVLSCRLPYCSKDGTLPFDITLLENRLRIVEGTLRPDLAAVRLDAPPAVVLLMQRCWAAEPSKRPDMADVVHMLAATLDDFHAAHASDSIVPKPAAELGKLLLEACEDGRADDALRLIINGADKNFVGEQSRTPLIWASRKGLEAVAAQLVGAGAKLDLVDKSGFSALIWASFNGHAVIAQLLVDNGAKPDLVDKDGWSALICASFNGHAAIAQLLAARLNAAALNLVDARGKTALDYANEGGGGKDKVAGLAPAAAAIRHRGGFTAAWLELKPRA